jgi:hypothetical protein
MGQAGDKENFLSGWCIALHGLREMFRAKNGLPFAERNQDSGWSETFCGAIAGAI